MPLRFFVARVAQRRIKPRGQLCGTSGSQSYSTLQQQQLEQLLVLFYYTSFAMSFKAIVAAAVATALFSGVQVYAAPASDSAQTYYGDGELLPFRELDSSIIDPYLISYLLLSQRRYWSLRSSQPEHGPRCRPERRPIRWRCQLLAPHRCSL